MKPKLMIGIILAVTAVLIYNVLTPDKPKKKPPPPPPPTSAPVNPAPTNPAPPPKEEPRSQDRKVWPYVTGDYKVTLAEARLTRNFVLIFDGSGSMNEIECSNERLKIEVAKEAVVGWLQSVPPAANLGLVAFHDKLKELTVVEIEPGNRAKLKETVGRFNGGGSTPLATAFASAYKLLEKQAQRQLGYGEYNIVVVTDGKANDAKTLTHNVNFILKFSPVNIFTIGFCLGQDHTLNQPGRTLYNTANNPAELRQGLEQVLAEADSFDLQDF